MIGRVIHGALLADAGLCIAKASVVALVCVGMTYGEVSPRGDTATHVSRGADARSLIVPAPAIRDVSYNAFDRFDVDRPGAMFLNDAIKARTIVAEVFSGGASRIEGPVGVQGPRANLIFANRNGITINGGSFVNFGSVALSTGAVALRDVNIAPGHGLRYVDVATTDGHIQIGKDGLSADLIHLELIAKTIGIEGPVVNSYTSPTALTRLVIGESGTRFDTAASPTDNLTPWAYHTVSAQGVARGIAIEINADSSIRSGRIEMHVTDNGAGVRNAGELLATSGGFTLRANGDIEQSGGRISAAGPVLLDGRTFSQGSANKKQSQVLSASSVRLDMTGGIHNIGGLIQGTRRETDSEDTAYAVMLNAGGTIENRGVAQDVGAVIFGAADDVRLRAASDIVNADARIVSNAGLRAESGGTIRIATSHVEGSGRTAWKKDDQLLLGILERNKSGYTVDLGRLTLPGKEAYVVAEGGIQLNAAEFSNSGGYVFSNAGDINVKLDGAFENIALAVGTFSYRKSCVLFLCDREAASTERLVGGQINAAGEIHVQAGDEILTRGGQLYALGDIELEAPSIVAQGMSTHTAMLREDGLKAWFGDTWARIYSTDQGGFVTQNGRLILRGAARQERGHFIAGAGTEGEIEVIEPPRRDLVRIEDHLGILFW